MKWDSSICYRCGKKLLEGEGLEARGHFYCKECFDEHFCYCEKCGTPEFRSFVEARADDIDGKRYCRECFENTPTYCDNCGAVILSKRGVVRRYGHRYCFDCFEKLYVECEVCHMDWPREDMIMVDGKYYCCGNCFVRGFLEKWDGSPCVIKKEK